VPARQEQKRGYAATVIIYVLGHEKHGQTSWRYIRCGSPPPVPFLASGKSKGIRLVSAYADIRYMENATNCPP